MIRFRHKDDERRYLRLMSQVYRLVARRLPPEECSTVLRNLGKMQDMLLFEGVRQGAAAAAIAEMMYHREGFDNEPYDMLPFQLHAAIYGAHDTPLHEVEKRFLDDMDVTDGVGWIDPEPMEFAPDTEEASEREAAPVPAVLKPLTPEEEAKTSWDGWNDDDIQKELGLDDDDTPAFESPQSLDIIRDALLQMSKPDTYQDMILTLSRNLHIDAAFLDMQLGTEAGRTVLAQVNMADLHPGPMGLDLSGTSPVAFISPEEAQKRMEGGG